MNSVRIEQGRLTGIETDGVHSFLGIPYAAPPTGDLRWRPPSAPAGWDGVREATRFGNAAIQTANTGMDLGAPESEDCLNLNVWTTSLEESSRQPVMVWIHGGGFLNGSSSLTLWQGDRLCRSGVTVVSMNYRLGAFGYLTHKDVGANFGVQDWIAALDWVRANIAVFGGDPKNVTVFGQSAGAAGVRALLSAPAARGLFHKAIIQSAGFEDYAVVGSPTFRRAAEASTQLLDQLGGGTIEDLRQAPTEDVRKASLALSGIFPPPGEVHTPANLVWYPVVDHDVIHDDFPGWPEDVPVLIGCTEDEARMFVQPTLLYAHPEVKPEEAYTQDTLRNMALALGGDRSDAILAHFATTSLTAYEAIAELITAGVWHEPALASFDRFADLGRSCYAYRFARVSPGARQSGLLAKHSAEVPYLFGTMVPPAAHEGLDSDVSRALQHAWTEFARTGAPTFMDGSAWPVYDRAQPELVWIGDTTEIRPSTPSRVTELIRSARGAVARPDEPN